jgi:hypothetical protein
MAKTKVSAQDIVALSKKEGFLAKQLYMVFTTPTKGIEPVMKVVKEHLEFQVALEKQGIMFAAGPNGRRKVVGGGRHGCDPSQIACRGDGHHEAGPDA